jgi:hypothetical protein
VHADTRRLDRARAHRGARIRTVTLTAPAASTCCRRDISHDGQNNFLCCVTF